MRALIPFLFLLQCCSGIFVEYPNQQVRQGVIRVDSGWTWATRVNSIDELDIIHAIENGTFRWYRSAGFSFIEDTNTEGKLAVTAGPGFTTRHLRVINNVWYERKFNRADSSFTLVPCPTPKQFYYYQIQ